jgi:hypothetical protein
MSDPERIYFLVEPGPLLDACEDWRKRHIAHREASVALSKSKGSDGVWSSTPNGATSSLSLVEPVPAGWVKRKARRSDEYFMEPAKGPSGDAARAEIAALPPMPDHHEIAVLINHPGKSVHYTIYGEDGKQLRQGERYGPTFWYEAKLLWAHHDEAPLQIEVTDLESTIDSVKADYPGCTITKGLWTPPAGLKRITRAESDLIIAQSAVDAEHALARAKEESEPANETPTVGETPHANRRHRP